MCVVSMIMDQAPGYWPRQPQPYQTPNFPPMNPFQPSAPGPTSAQFEEFLKLIRQAKAFDKATSQPHCEDPEKVRKVAEILTPGQLGQLRDLLNE